MAAKTDSKDSKAEQTVDKAKQTVSKAKEAAAEKSPAQKGQATKRRNQRAAAKKRDEAQAKARKTRQANERKARPQTARRVWAQAVKLHNQLGELRVEALKAGEHDLADVVKRAGREFQHASFTSSLNRLEEDDSPAEDFRGADVARPDGS